MQHEIPPPSTPHGKVGVAFASALVDGDFERAHGMLAPELQRQLAPDDLRRELYGMFEGYADGKPERIHFDEDFAHDEWPGKLPGDLGYAYVSIEGEDFVEAVTVTVADFAGKHLVRDIDWGRP